MVSKKFYVHIVAEGIDHRQLVDDDLDIKILECILDRVKQKAEQAVSIEVNVPFNGNDAEKIINDIREKK